VPVLLLGVRHLHIDCCLCLLLVQLWVLLLRAQQQLPLGLPRRLLRRVEDRPLFPLRCSVFELFRDGRRLIHLHVLPNPLLPLELQLQSAVPQLDVRLFGHLLHNLPPDDLRRQHFQLHRLLGELSGVRFGNQLLAVCQQFLYATCRLLSGLPCAILWHQHRTTLSAVQSLMRELQWATQQ
jgi:hypothetical protein